MKRRSFLKGLGVALIAPTAMMSRGLEAAVPQSYGNELNEDNTSIYNVSWGKDITATEVERRQSEAHRQVVELLNETNPILKDMHFKSERFSFNNIKTRTGLPNATWRMLNGSP